MRKLQPDAIVQFAAGIRQRQTSKSPPWGSVNLDPGIAPLTKGRDPIHWSLCKRRPKWSGATVHLIDEGIYTGPVLAYAPVKTRYWGERYPALFARVYESGVQRLVEVLRRLDRGEHWTVEYPEGEHIYRSTISGVETGRFLAPRCPGQILPSKGSKCSQRAYRRTSGGVTADRE